VLLSSSARWEVTRSTSVNTVTYGADGATFTIPGGSSSSNRVELQAENANGTTFKTYPGDDRYVGVDIRLHAGYPSGTGGGSGFNLLMQWKDWDAGGESASPPVSLAVEGGQYRLRGGATQDRMPCRQTFSYDLAPMDNLNHRWVFHVYNGRPGVGYVEVWRDGVKLRDKVYPPCGTVYPEPTDALMHRIGMYRGGGITTRGTVTYRDYKMTDTYASAAAR
jgi:hypothetical protein